MKRNVLISIVLFGLLYFYSQETNVEQINKTQMELACASQAQNLDTAFSQQKEMSSDFDQKQHDKEARQAGFTPPAPGKALVEIIRVTINGAMTEFFIFYDTTIIGSVKGVSHVRLELDPGEHIIWISEDINEFVKITVDANKTYFIYQENVFAKMCHLNILMPDEYERISRGLNVINKYPPRIMSKIDLMLAQKKKMSKRKVRKAFDSKTGKIITDPKRTHIITADKAIPAEFLE